MDAVACLLVIDAALNNEDYGEAWDYIDFYARWRQKGGFEPPHGDKTWGKMVVRYLKGTDCI